MSPQPALDASWLYAALTGNQRFPNADASATSLENAVGFYESLDRGSRTQMGRAVLEALAAVRVVPSEREVVYLLLQLTAYIKPLGAPELLRKLLVTGELRRLSNSGESLDVLAVRACSE